MSTKTLIRFFKMVCSTDFTRILRLPDELMRIYGSILPTRVKLRIIESGRTWDVKVKAMDDGFFYFSRGWNVFSKDVGLKFGELVVFVLDDDGFTFDVSVYGIKGCIKDFTVSQDDDDDDGTITRGFRTPLYYEFVLKPHTRYRLTLKRSFLRAAGLMGKEGVEVEGKHGKVFVKLDISHRDSNRVDLACGWSEFRTVNDLVSGKTYSFEFNQTKNVIQYYKVGMNLVDYRVLGMFVGCQS
ncbi:hypothetical protein ACS0TY_030490 [Phlomoides rotata]